MTRSSRRLDKGHTRAGFLEALALMRDSGLPLCPDVHPVHTRGPRCESYRAFLRDPGRTRSGRRRSRPIQLAIRLLIPEGSLLLELPGGAQAGRPVRSARALLPLAQSRPRAGRLCVEIQETIKREEKRRTPRAEIFRQIWDLAQAGEFPDLPLRRARRFRI